MDTPQTPQAAAPSSTPYTGKKLLFADFAVVKYGPISQNLRRDGVITDAVTDPARFQSKIREEHYDVCLVNLLLGGQGPFELIRNLRTSSRNPDIKIIVISKQVQRSNIQNTMKAGAHDFVADPVDPENLYHRILYHLSVKKIIDVGGLQDTPPSADAWPYISALLRSNEQIGHAMVGHEQPTYFKILSSIADLLKSNRTSLMIVDEELAQGVVLATSDDPGFYDFPIVLHKYPEVMHVMHSGVFVLIDDVTKSALTKDVPATVQSIEIGSMMVFPIWFGDEVVGVLNIRRSKATELPPMDVLRILQAVANTFSSTAYFRARLRKIYKEFEESRSKIKGAQIAPLTSDPVPGEQNLLEAKILEDAVHQKQDIPTPATDGDLSKLLTGT